MNTHITHSEAPRVPAAVPVFAFKPCPRCRPLDPFELNRSKDCPRCGGRLFVEKVVGYVGKEGACA